MLECKGGKSDGDHLVQTLNFKDRETEIKNVKQLSKRIDLGTRAVVKTHISDSINHTFILNVCQFLSPHVNNMITSSLIPNHHH